MLIMLIGVFFCVCVCLLCPVVSLRVLCQVCQLYNCVVFFRALPDLFHRRASRHVRALCFRVVSSSLLFFHSVLHFWLLLHTKTLPRTV